MPSSSTCFNLPTESPRLRSLLLFGQPSVGVEHEFSANEDWARLSMTAVFERFKLLKLLDLVGIETSSGKLPKQIGDLVHLRYLRIRNTNIRRLPKSIARLNNLLTLDYWGVYVDTDIELPNVLWKLEQLRHLYLPYEMSTSMEDFKLHTLPNLQILWGVAGGNWMLKEMGKLSKTLQKLCIQGISSPGQLEAVFSLPSIKSNTLSSLLLDWYGFELPSLDPLHTTERLQKLRLKGRFRDKLAIRDQLKPFKFPASLVKLELYYTQIERQETMEALEKLPNLKFLRMSKDSYIGSQWSIQAGGFPQLVELKLFSLPNLEEWKMETGAIPLLRGLSIMSCLKLKGIPEGLKSIEQLEALEIERMPPAFCSRVRPEDSGSEGEDHHIIKHVPCVVISNPLATW